MRTRYAALLPILLAACATPPPSLAAQANPRGFVWIATPRPEGGDAARSAQFQKRVVAALARRGYRQDPHGTLGVALSFSGMGDPSLGQRQGGYAVFLPATPCDAPRAEQPLAGCLSFFRLPSGQLIGVSNRPIDLNSDDGSIDRALGAALGANDQANDAAGAAP